MTEPHGASPADSPRRPDTTVLLERRRMPGLRLAVVAWLVAAASVAVVTVPVLDGVVWSWVGAGLAVVSALVIALPSHREALDGLRSGRVGAETLGSLGVVAAAGATVAAALSDRPVEVAVAATVPVALMLTATALTGGVRFLPSPAWFAPVVIVLALAAGAVWFMLDDGVKATAVVVSVLAAAGPAAKVLASPLSLVVARQRLRGFGIALSDADAVVAVERVRAVVLEKDGTVTTGRLRVVSVDPIEPDHDRNLRWFAGALEHASDHRIGQAISTLAMTGRLSHVEQLPGRGIRGSVDRHPVRVGAPDWLGMDVPDGLWTTVGVEVDARALGTITVADDVRADAADGVTALRRLGLDVTLLSSDRPDRTLDVANQVGIDDAHPSLDPAARSRVLDDVAGRAADGRDGAVLVAGCAPTSPACLDVVRLGLDDLDVSRVARAVEAARSTTHRARRARAVALGLGLLGAAAATTGFLAPWGAAVVAVAVAAATAWTASA